MPSEATSEDAPSLRARALRACDAGLWDECVHGLDAAAELDPAGEADARVVEARAGARRAMGIW